MSLDISHYPLLAQANTPDELRQLPQERLTDLCDELRQYLLRLTRCWQKTNVLTQPIMGK